MTPLVHRQRHWTEAMFNYRQLTRATKSST